MDTAGIAAAGTAEGVVGFTADGAATACDHCSATGESGSRVADRWIGRHTSSRAAIEGEELAQRVLRAGLRGKKRTGREHGGAHRALTVLHERHHGRAKQRHDHQNEDGDGQAEATLVAVTKHFGCEPRDSIGSIPHQSGNESRA